MSDLPPAVKQKVIKDWRSDYHAIEKFQFLYFFLPHPSKRKRAELLSNKALLVYCILILILIGIFRLIPKIAPGVLGYASDIKIEDLLEYTNNRRKEAGLKELVINEKLSAAAKKKADDMFKNNYWAHVSPNGTEPWDFILSEDYDYIYAGENLAKNFSDSKEVVQAWYDSPSHRDNLLSDTYDEIGFAVVNGTLDDYETTLVVQMFGRPRNRNGITTKEQEQKVLKEITKEAVSHEAENLQVQPETEKQLNPEHIKNKNIPVIEQQSPQVLPLIDVKTVTHGISIVFGMFILTLLLADIWYSKHKGILKFTGHTFVHILFLLVVLFSIWFFIKPGVVL